MLNTLFTLQETLFLNKKSLCFYDFFFLFLLEGIHALWIRNFCWLQGADCGNHWFLPRWSLTDMICKLHFEGSTSFLLPFCHISLVLCVCVSIHVPFTFKKQTTILMAGSIAFCLSLPHPLGSNSFDRKRSTPFFPSLTTIIISWTWSYLGS